MSQLILRRAANTVQLIAFIREYDVFQNVADWEQQPRWLTVDEVRAIEDAWDGGYAGPGGPHSLLGSIQTAVNRNRRTQPRFTDIVRTVDRRYPSTGLGRRPTPKLRQPKPLKPRLPVRIKPLPKRPR